MNEDKLLQLLSKGNKLNRSELLFALENPQFERMPCPTFTQFVDSLYYLGVGQDTYKKIKEEGDKIWDLWSKGKITEAILLWGIGSGKSYLAEGMMLKILEWLLSLRNPHKYFKLANDKPICVVNMGTTSKQAKNVIFAGMKKFIQNSDFFMKFRPEILNTEIRFKQKNIALYCGNSQETMPIGLNVIAGALDEAAWYLDTENKSIAENITSIMRNRISSRFGNSGLLMILSSVRYAEDYISQHYEDSKNIDFIYCSKFKTWEVRDRDKMSNETFEFVAEMDKDGNPLEVWKDIPVDFKRAAETNPEKFMRDFGAKPSLVLEAFDRDAGIIERLSSDRECPTDSLGGFKDWFKAGDKTERFIHIDLALKKDACGFAMGKENGYDMIEGEKRARIYMDLVLQIKAIEGGEIQFSDVRQLIYSLQDRGFNIKKVTYDGWQSVDSIQILKGRGITAEVLSVDKDTKAYDTLKECLHTNRFDCYKYPQLHYEYKRLELIKGKRVDHPQGGSKDVSDSVAGVCFNVVENLHSFTFSFGGQVFDKDKEYKVEEKPKLGMMPEQIVQSSEEERKKAEHEADLAIMKKQLDDAQSL